MQTLTVRSVQHHSGISQSPASMQNLESVAQKMAELLHNYVITRNALATLRDLINP